MNLMPVDNLLSNNKVEYAVDEVTGINRSEHVISTQSGNV